MKNMLLILGVGLGLYALYRYSQTTVSGQSEINAPGWTMYSSLLAQGVDAATAEAQVQAKYPGWSSMSA